MTPPNIDREAILRDAYIITTANIGSHPQLTSAFTLCNHVMSKLLGRVIYLVTWPNGAATMVDADPGTRAWDDLLVNAYVSCLQNYFGPVWV